MTLNKSKNSFNSDFNDAFIVRSDCLISGMVKSEFWSSSPVYMYQTPAEACQPPPRGLLFRGVIGRAVHRDALGSQQFITPSKPISDTRKYAETRDGCVRREREMDCFITERSNGCVLIALSRDSNFMFKTTLILIRPGREYGETNT